MPFALIPLIFPQRSKEMVPLLLFTVTSIPLGGGIFFMLIEFPAESE